MKARITTIALISVLVGACSSGGSDAPPPPPANMAPTISQIQDQSTTANQASAPIAFTVSDEDVGSLSFTLMSDNQPVVPDDGLVLGGSGTSRTLTVTPVVDTLGDSMLTIIVTDTGGLSASASFLLTIAAEQQSLQQFTRDTFALAADGDPELINAVEFTQDAEDDDFADLLAQ